MSNQGLFKHLVLPKLYPSIVQWLKRKQAWGTDLLGLQQHYLKVYTNVVKGNRGTIFFLCPPESTSFQGTGEYHSKTILQLWQVPILLFGVTIKCLSGNSNLCQVYKEQNKPRGKHFFNTSKQSHSQAFYLFLEDGTTEKKEV